MERAVVELKSQSTELNLSEELRRRQQSIGLLQQNKKQLSGKSKPLAIRDPLQKSTPFAFLTETSQSEYMDRIYSEDYEQPSGMTPNHHLTDHKIGLLQTDESDEALEWEINTSSRHSSKHGSPLLGPQAAIPESNPESLTTGETKTPLLTVDPEQLMERATLDTLHFFRGIIFEVQTVRNVGSWELEKRLQV
jgi:hypothetical protein